MCDLPGCPAGDSPPPLPLDDETIPQMKAEATAAALHILRFFGRGWTNACQGLLSDQSDKWGFPGVTRCMWIMAQATAILPYPADAPPLRTTPQELRERLAALGGEAPTEAMVTQMVTMGDQVESAFNEMVALAKAQDEDAFNLRFDQVTDQENVLQPLAAGLMLHGSVVFTAAFRDRNTFALDQFQAACRTGLELAERDEETAKEMKDLTAMFNLPDATEPGH